MTLVHTLPSALSRATPMLRRSRAARKSNEAWGDDPLRMRRLTRRPAPRDAHENGPERTDVMDERNVASE